MGTRLATDPTPRPPSQGAGLLTRDENMNTDRVHITDRSRTDLVIRNDEGPVEEGLTYSEALAAMVSRYTSEDEV